MFLIEVYVNKNIWRRGILPSRKVGQVWRVYKPDPAAWLKGQRPRPTGDTHLSRAEKPLFDCDGQGCSIISEIIQ